MSAQILWSCDHCGDVMPAGFGEDDHFDCNWPNDVSPVPVVSDAARARFPYPGFVGHTLEEVWALRVEFDRFHPSHCELCGLAPSCNQHFGLCERGQTTKGLADE